MDFASRTIQADQNLIHICHTIIFVTDQINNPLFELADFPDLKLGAQLFRQLI